MLGVVAERLATRGLLILAKPRLSEANLRTLRAFAEAMAPGTHGMPRAAGPDGPAAGEVDVAAPLAEYLSALPAERVSLIRLALRAFEWAPFPWRFSRASLEARQDFLRNLDREAGSTREDLLLLLKVLTASGYANDARVREAVGSEVDLPGRRRAAGAPDPPPARRSRPTRRR